MNEKQYSKKDFLKLIKILRDDKLCGVNYNSPKKCRTK